jgi:type VI secretion system protein ImpK
MADSDDPFLPSNLTSRPRPGAGRRGAADQTGSFPRAATPRGVDFEPIPQAARAFLGIGLNPLVQAASPLLLLMGQLRSAPASLDIGSMRRYALDEVRRFEEAAAANGVRNEIVLAARYVLCAGIDEAVLSTPSGAQSEWAQHPLLIALHREAWGGEKFFDMLDRITPDPGRHIDLIELQYLILALGFTGKYQMLDRGHEKLADLQRNLHRLIRNQRGGTPAELSLRWRGLEDQRNRLIRYVPWWVVAAAALAVLAVTFTIYYSRLANQAAPLHARLGQIGVGDFAVPPPPVPVKGPTLKQLLQPEESAGLLSATEDGGRTVVTIQASDLFRSGSADINPSHQATLDRIAAAINQVPGRVQVVGHTDDQAIRTLRYADNNELSRERAVSVARVLQRTVLIPARITWRGVGSSQPVAVGTDAESRARNRRVEIIHLHEG